MPFPLSPAPSYYAVATHTARSGIYYSGDTVSVTLSQATPTSYYIYDYYGNSVETGTVTSTTLTLKGPFNPGWYRVYMVGASNDANFGPSYGAWSFIVIPKDSRLVTNPASNIGIGIGAGENHDVIVKGVLGIGTSRIQIGDASNYTFGADNLNNAITTAGFGDTYWNNPVDSAFDPNRPRTKWLQFPNGTSDHISVTTGGSDWLDIYPLNAPSVYDWNSLYISVQAGSTSGYKVTVYYPDSVTVVETFDNLASGNAASSTINGSSNYIRAWTQNSSGTPNLFAAKAIGSAYRTGVIAVVSTLYPYGYTRFEGPQNEPLLSARGAEFAWRMKWFQDAVHAGNSAAIAMGPCPVQADSSHWNDFLANGGAAYCDEFSTHAYNSQTNGDINLGRTQWEAFFALLKSYGVDTKPVWHTEATGVYCAVFGVHHPRRSGVPLRQTLLAEQYGIPREKNLVWYDKAHSFWGEPRWIELKTSGIVPYGALYRTLAAETFGMTHYHRLDFGSEAANRIWMGSLYIQNKKSLGPSCLVLCMNSNMPGATVDLNITGTTANITYVDGFGNMTSVAQSAGIVTIPTSEIPTYVRLPAGVTATVHQVNDWGTSVPPSISSYGTATDTRINDDQFMTSYGPVGVYTSPNTLPDTAQIIFLANATFQRVIIFCGGTWQNLSALTTFTVDTTTDGTNWTTQKTIDVSATCTSFQHGSDGNSEGCKQETYWPEQWIFDVKFAAPVTALGVRVNATNGSYGGEPDAAAKAAGGQGANAPKITLQEIMVLSTSTPGF